MKVLLNQTVNLANFNSSKNNTIKNKIENEKTENLNDLPQKRDLVSFRALTKAKLKGFDLAMIEKLKAPLQNFRDVEHIQRWAGARFLGLGFEKVKSRTKQGAIQKNAILKEWYKYLDTGNEAYPNTLKFLIYSSLLAGLSDKDDKLPPNLNKGVLADTVVQIEKELAENPKAQFNFNKAYTANLKKLELNEEKSTVDSTGTGWVMIPSLKNDPTNFKENVEKLQNLSHDNWCTKSFNAEPYLKKGDFHIYLENGKPKLGVRFEDDTVVEIQGEKNNSRIPEEYFETFKAHQQEYSIKASDKAAEEIDRVGRVVPLIKKIKEELGETIEIKSIEDAERILDCFGIKHERTSNNLLAIPEYSKIGFNGVFLSDIGCEEENLWDYIGKIEGNADFSGCELKPFKNLTEIGGNVLLDNYANLNNFGSLKRIGGDLTLKECYLDSLGDLEYIGGNFINESEYLKETDNLKEIGGDIDFSNFDTLNNLEKVGGNVKIKGYNLENLGSLKRIDGNVEILRAGIKTLGNLESIGGNLTIDESDIESFGKLKTIEGNLNIADSKVETFGDLNTIKGNIESIASKIENFGNLELVGGDFNIENCHELGLLLMNCNLKEIGGNVFIYDTWATEADFASINIKGIFYPDSCAEGFLKDF